MAEQAALLRLSQEERQELAGALVDLALAWWRGRHPPAGPAGYNPAHAAGETDGATGRCTD